MTPRVDLDAIEARAAAIGLIGTHDAAGMTCDLADVVVALVAELRETRDEVERLTALVHAKEAWIDGAKVDMGAFIEANDGLGAALVHARAASAAHYVAGYYCRCGTEVNSASRHMADAAVDAAAPVLLAAHEAEVRAKIAAEIASHCRAEHSAFRGTVENRIICWKCRESIGAITSGAL